MGVNKETIKVKYNFTEKEMKKKMDVKNKQVPYQGM